jgi:hypothetical protein
LSDNGRFVLRQARPFRPGLPLYSQCRWIIRRIPAEVKGRTRKNRFNKNREAPRKGRLWFDASDGQTELTSSAPASSSYPDIRTFRTWFALS